MTYETKKSSAQEGFNYEEGIRNYAKRRGFDIDDKEIKDIAQRCRNGNLSILKDKIDKQKTEKQR